MKTYLHSLSIGLSLISLCCVMSSCATKENTARSRFMHAFTTRYNVYFNGNEAYKAGMEEKLTSNQDNYTARLPLFIVGNKQTQELGKASLNTAIIKSEKAIKLHSIKRRPTVNNRKRRTEKEKEFLQRKEYNPFLYKAWLLMGKAQYEQGSFVEAASTFAYTMRLYATQAAIRQTAATWLVRCYTQLGWFYEAEDALNKLQRDSIAIQVRPLLEATLADLYLTNNQLEKSLPYLTKTAKKMPKKLLRARAYYILGQVYTALGKDEQAYTALQKCIRMSPPYELAFNARILQTEVMAHKDGRNMLAKLRRMARSQTNKDYLDQVYYAMGNIHIFQRDTTAAITAYEMGEQKSQRNGINKGVLLLRLGELYYIRHNFEGAQRCYGQVIGLIDKEHAGYELAYHRSKILDELVPYTTTIHLQDSLQALARMPEAERNAAIDRVITALKKAEEEAKKEAKDSLLQVRNQAGSMTDNNMRTPVAMQGNNKEWYFYNPMLVSQGKAAFKKQWGTRTLSDDWRRSNKTVLSAISSNDSTQFSEVTTDSAIVDTTMQPATPVQDPHQRAYYLAQIPFSETQKAASDELIQSALFAAGLIEKDKLEDYPIAAKTLTRLYTAYPDFAQMDEVYYQLYLLYMRWGKETEAEHCKEKLAALFPNSNYSKTITAPNFVYLARHGVAIEDSLYSATYEDFKKGRHTAVLRGAKESDRLFPEGANRPKFLLLRGLTYLGQANKEQALHTLTTLVQDFPQSDVSELAGLIVKGIREGRQLGNGTYDFASLWQQRSAAQQTITDSLTGKPIRLSKERQVPFTCVLVFSPDSVQQDALLFEISRFNFNSFLVRNFSVQISNEPGLQQLRITNFRSYDEAYAYTKLLMQDSLASKLMQHVHTLLISEQNLRYIGSAFSYAEYEKFYKQYFEPIQRPRTINIDTPPLPQVLQENLPPEIKASQQVTQEDKTITEEQQQEDEGEWYDIE